MQSMESARTPLRFGRWIVMASLATALCFSFSNSALCQEHDMENMPGMETNVPLAAETQAQTAKRLADKQESEFNHHLAGVLLIIAGLFILFDEHIRRRSALSRYVWPTCFLLAGLFVLIFSDTEIWPFGPQTPWYAITHNVEDLQHKIFALILLAIGCIELQRARGRLTALWAAWFFPVIGVTGAILLLFHVHGGDMRAPRAMETMEHIQNQHRWFAATGLGIALSNGLAGTPQKWQQLFKKAWPFLLIMLGVLLTRYTE
jgi:uncharacterized membrane protein